MSISCRATTLKCFATLHEVLQKYSCHPTTLVLLLSLFDSMDPNLHISSCTYPPAGLATLKQRCLMPKAAYPYLRCRRPSALGRDYLGWGLQSLTVPRTHYSWTLQWGFVA